jgi:hypothetical protein
MSLALRLVPAVVLACTAADPSTTATSPIGVNCPVWGCNENSGVVDNHGLHEVSRLGERNPDSGIYLHSFTKDGTHYQIDLIGTTLVGRDAAGAIALAHEDLVGAVIELHMETLPTTFQLVIKEVDRLGAAYWHGAPDTVETYLIEYGIDGDDPGRTFCSSPPEHSGPGVEMNTHHVLVFGSERYDAATKTITASGAAADGWMNFGCAGGALAKLLLNRHVPVAATTAISPTVTTRQAMLKMYAADYCGDGTPFTFAHEPLAWADAGGLQALPLAFASYEARWTSTGASCLSRPRLDVTLQPWPGDLHADIAAGCGGALPVCSGLPVGSFGGAAFISVNPTGS